MSEHDPRIECLDSRQRVKLYRILRDKLGSEDQPVQGLVALYPASLNSEELEAIKLAAKTRLTEQERPVRYVPTSDLPMTPQGKLDRQSLPALVPSQVSDSQANADDGATVSALVDEVIAAFAETLNQTGISSQSNFFQLGGHSLSLVECILAIETRTGHRVSTTSFLQHPTPIALADLIETAGHQRYRYLYRVADRLEGLPVFVISASRLAYAMAVPDENWQLFGVQLRWVDEQGELIDYQNLAQLAQKIAVEIDTVVENGAFVLAGSSFAAMVAFEISVQLANAGKQPALTVLIEPSPLSGLRSWLQHDLESDTSVSYAQHWYLLKWLYLNNPFRARFWTRIAKLLAIDTSAKQSADHAQPASVSQQQALERKRTFAIWQGYRPSAYEGRMALLSTTERGWQIEHNWRRYLPHSTSRYSFESTHEGILLNPFMGDEVVPVLQNEIESAVAEWTRDHHHHHR